MGREMRRVPEGWEHPCDGEGNYIPMQDETYQHAAREWLDGAIAWDNGTHPELIADPSIKEHHPFYWEWFENPPDPEADYFRPEFTSKPTCYQLYENVSDGTPISPVFETFDEMRRWLISQGEPENSYLVKGITVAGLLKKEV
jgi:hypothetical protein